MKTEDWIADELASCRRQGLDRHLKVLSGAGGKITLGGKVMLNLASNDYLDLSRHPAVISAAIGALRNFGAGATASRLVTGTLAIHEELEHALAKHKGYPSSLVFGSGYMTNSGVITSLVGRSDTVFVDKLAHASILDAVMLSRAKLCRFRHNDVQHLVELLRKSGSCGRRLIVTESVFSMDGDVAPLSEIAAVAHASSAMLMVDEAHSTGVFGPAGAGLARELKLEKDITVSMGTLSKALGGYGGFAAFSVEVRELMINVARSFIFSTGLPPASAASALAALGVLAARPFMGKDLLKKADVFRKRLKDAGLDTGNSTSQIIPVMVADNRLVIELAGRLRKRDIIVAAIRPPAVPVGTARLRLSVTLAHTADDLERASEEIVRAAKDAGIV
ncbi:MAG: 8-amino-7-oxononanoate synthase [bacterium]